MKTWGITNVHQRSSGPFVLTEVLDGVVALLVVHFDGLGVRTADAVADGVAAHHDVLVLRRRPADHDAVDQRPDVEGAGLVWHSGFCGGKSKRKSFSISVKKKEVK